MSDLFGDGYGRLKRSAEISECGQYRYGLHRTWSGGGNGKVCCFIMLNPSKADADIDDPTIKRCMAFTQAWGYSTLSVLNLFAFRSTNPAGLLTVADPVGPKNDAAIVAAKTADLVIAAWGGKVPYKRDEAVLKLLEGKPLYCLCVGKKGSPWHPLYVPGSAEPIPFRP